MKQSPNNLPIWTRKLERNGSSVSPAWTAFACDGKFLPRLSTFLTNLSASPTFSFRILCGADVLVQGHGGDFLVCIATARKHKLKWTHRLPFSDLRIQFFYPSGKLIQFEEIKAGLNALDAPPPMDKAGNITGPSVGETVMRRCATAVQVTPVRSAARTGVICAAGGRGFAVAVDCAFSQAGVVAPPDGPDFGNVTVIYPVALGALVQWPTTR